MLFTCKTMLLLQRSSIVLDYLVCLQKILEIKNFLIGNYYEPQHLYKCFTKNKYSIKSTNNYYYKPVYAVMFWGVSRIHYTIARVY